MRYRLGLGRLTAPPPGTDREAAREMLRAVLRHRWKLARTDEILVREIACPHKDCGGFETVAYVRREGRQIATLVVACPLGALSMAQIEAALASHPQADDIQKMEQK